MIEMRSANTADEFHAKTSVTVIVTGVADVGITRAFSPQRLKLDYLYSSKTGHWKVDGWEYSGPNRLKDGSLSTKMSGRRYGWGRYDANAAPAWVRVAIDHYRPVGTVTFETRPTTAHETMEA